jgi:hypothetical protein
MTTCILEEGGTIGYIDSGHGHAEGLTEISLKNADGKYLNSKEAAAGGGIMSATLGAGIPDSLESNFGNVNLLNRDGPSTWPIVAMTYVYVRKDLSYIAEVQEQTLLKAFLKALYKDNYVDECDGDFGFVRVSGELKDRAILAIDGLLVGEGAEDWVFEESTFPRVGSLDYVISQKRESYSEIQQDRAVDMVGSLQSEIKVLKTENKALKESIGSLGEELQQITTMVGEVETASKSATQDDELIFGEDEETALKAALALSIISFALWMLALIFVFAKFVFRCF